MYVKIIESKTFVLSLGTLFINTFTPSKIVGIKLNHYQNHKVKHH